MHFLYLIFIVLKEISLKNWYKVFLILSEQSGTKLKARSLKRARLRERSQQIKRKLINATNFNN
jgi:hypothetical protein